MCLMNGISRVRETSLSDKFFDCVVVFIFLLQVRTIVVWLRSNTLWLDSLFVLVVRMEAHNRMDRCLDDDVV